MSALTFAERHSDEWARAWSGLQELGFGPDDECPCCGETWQYMGTVERGAARGAQFRHRHHPKAGRRLYVEVAV